MKPINFSTLCGKYPEFVNVWQKLLTWFTLHKDKRKVKLLELIDQLPNLDKVHLVVALHVMVEEDMLKPFYKVTTQDDEFDDIEDIPEGTEGDFVTCFRW